MSCDLKIMVKFEPERAIYLAIKRSPHSMTNRRHLTKDLGVSAETIKKYVELMLFERLIQERQVGHVKLLTMIDERDHTEVFKERKERDDRESYDKISRGTMCPGDSG